MPNYVTNVVTLTGSDEEIKDFFERIKDDSQGIGTIDFNKIIPMPKDLEIESGSRTTYGMKMVKAMISEKMLETNNSYPDWETIDAWQKEAIKQIPEDDVEIWELGVQALHNIERYGEPTWYEWCIENWGTKWGSCGFEHGRIADNQFVFQTAWNAPHPIMKKLSEMFPKLEISHDWADEDFGQNCGNREYKNGTATNNYPQTQKEAYEFAAKVMRCDVEDVGLRINATGTNYVWCDFESYELVSLWGKPALFCEERISEDDIPEGMHLYQLRHPSDEIYTLEQSNVEYDFAGSIITDYDIDFFDSHYLILNDSNFRVMDDVGYLSFDDYLEKNFNFDQSNQILGDM